LDGLLTALCESKHAAFYLQALRWTTEAFRISSENFFLRTTGNPVPVTLSCQPQPNNENGGREKFALSSSIRYLLHARRLKEGHNRFASLFFPKDRRELIERILESKRYKLYVLHAPLYGLRSQRQPHENLSRLMTTLYKNIACSS
jgi:hypothetical protein